MERKTFLSVKRNRKVIDYRAEDITLDPNNASVKDVVSTYIPSSGSDDIETNRKAKKKTTANTTTKNPPSCKPDLIWMNVADYVILCGQKSLHCYNVRNNLFCNYLHATVLLHFKFKNHVLFNREYAIDEIFSKLKDYEWQKMDDDGQFLTQSEIKMKIRKAVNDR